MEYYKMLQNDNIIGVVTSKQFMRYTPVTNCLVRCEKERGQYITYKNKLYRDSWLNPITININYEEAFIQIISKEEYLILFEAFKTNEIIKVEEPEEEIQPEPIQEEVNITLEFIRSSKIAEMSHACRTTIENGFDTNIRGETKHFSLDTQDQINLINLGMMAETEEQLPYHADGEDVIFYTAAEIKHIISEANDFKIYQTTYYNALKGYINSLNTIEEISSITYGIQIPDEYKTEVLEEIE